MKKYCIGLAVILLFSEKTFSQTWTAHNAGTVNLIMDVSFPTNDSGYVITDFCQIRKTYNAATSWTSVPVPPAPVYFLKFITVQTGVALGDSVIYKTINGGNNWTLVYTGSNIYFTSVFFVNTSVGYASSRNTMGDSIQLYKTLDAGSSWSKINTKFCYVTDQGLFFKNPSDGFWAYDNNIFSTADGGISFSSVYNDINYAQYFLTFAFPTVDTGYALDNLSLMRTVNGGISWSLVGYPGVIIYDLYFISGRIGFVCGGDGFSSGWIQETSDAGASWTPSYTSSYTFNCMDFPSDSVGYAGGQNGTVLRYTGTPNGIIENKNQNLLSIYPNPTTGSINITNAIPGAKIKLLNLTGQIIMEQNVEYSLVKMNLENIANGIYFVEMENAGLKSVQKIIISH